MQRVSWYLNRLRVMSFSEVLYRLRQAALRRMECAKWNLSRQLRMGLRRDVNYFDDSQAIDQFKEKLHTIFLWKNNKAIFTEHYLAGHDLKAWRHKRTARFPVFELTINPSQPDLDWHSHPRTAKRWPLLCAHAIDIRDAETVGEVDYTWRVNRCQHLIQLAQISFLLDDDDLARFVLDRIENWIDCNPHCTGVNWTNPMEQAIRCISWIISLAYVQEATRVPDEILRKIMTSMLEQADFIYRYRAQHSSANNHLIVELTGLITIGVVLSQNKQARYLLKRAIEELPYEVGKQVFPDGVSKEQSTHYHGLVLDCLLWVLVLSQRAGLDLPGIVCDRAEEMCQFIASLMSETGEVPQIGDSDDGYLLWLTDLEETSNYRSQLATGAVLFERPDFGFLARKYDEKTFWLLGAEGLEQFMSLPGKPPAPKSREFFHGGYYSLRAGTGEQEALLLFDCGPMGYPSTAAHGHADALSICLALGGHPILIDPGTYSYLEFPRWRDFFRSTACHNTIVVNESSQSEMAGPYLWARKAAARCETWFTCSRFDYVEGSHDGYRRRPHGVEHRRRIVFVKPHYWIVDDCLRSAGPFQAEAFFHFAAGLSSLESSDTHHSYSFSPQSGGPSLRIVVPADPLVHVRSLRGNDSSLQGWSSPRYARRISIPVLSVSIQAQLQTRFVYLLLPGIDQVRGDKKVGAVDVQQSSLAASRFAFFRLRSLDLQDDLYFLFDGGKALKLGDLVVRAQTICVRRGNDGAIHSVVLVAPSDIRLRGVHRRVEDIPFCILSRCSDDTRRLNLGPLGLSETLDLAPALEAEVI